MSGKAELDGLKGSLPLSWIISLFIKWQGFIFIFIFIFYVQ